MIFIKINNSDDEKNKLLLELNSDKIKDKEHALLNQRQKLRYHKTKCEHQS